ncbi:30S ribosomal protein S1 [Glycine soja]
MGSLPLTSSKPWFSPDKTRRRRAISLNHRVKVFASRSRNEGEKEPPKLDSHDLMELKFGRLLGEDPKLTLAKIMGRKVNPDASYLDIEKAFYKNKGKIVEVEEVPFEGSKGGSSSRKFDDLGLVRPVPAKGMKFKSDNNKPALEIKKPVRADNKEVGVRKSSVPHVILRKPAALKDDSDGDTLTSRLRMRPNLSLKMQDEQVKARFSDMTLLRKPEAAIQEPSSSVDDQGNDDGELKMWNGELSDEIGGFTLLERPHKPSGEKEESGEREMLEVNVMIPNDGLEQHEERQLEFHEESTNLGQLSDDSRVELSVEAALQAKPKRLDQYVKQTSKLVGEEGASLNIGARTNKDDLGKVVDMSDFQESEDADWTRAQDLIKTGDREDVELVSCNTKGFIVSFGSLVGFLPYRNLASKWKFLAFESWLKQKGLDPSIYKQNSGTITSFDAEIKNLSPDSPPSLEIDGKVEDRISPDMKLEDLLRIYDQEKLKFLSSFVGQKIKTNVLVADRKMRKLIFSLRPKEKEELVEKKRNLMAKLQVGDIVKCRVQKIAYFGIFVEVEEVSALIHQSELSWDATLNPASYFQIGQVLEAKVHQINFALERIFLSLKEVMPDPLMNSLEAIVGDHDPLDGRLKAAQTDVEWPEVDSLVEELQKIEGVQSVSKGRFFRSPGLAPTFQAWTQTHHKLQFALWILHVVCERLIKVYMASIFEDQYKLLARSGNKIQEVIVQTSLDKERMKSAVMTCANRVE